MKRENVLVSEDALARQREFEAKIKKMFTSREAHPVACVDTFGCQQNVADGQKLMGMLADSGFTFTEDPKEADLVILNTCAVREHAEQRVFGNVGALKGLKEKKPGLIIGLCGCMANQKHVVEKLRKSYPYVDLVFGVDGIDTLPQLIAQKLQKHKRVLLDPAQRPVIVENIPIRRESEFRAWLPIMYGCDNFCTYCIVPYTRGRERSRDPEQILNEVKQLVADGYKEIMLLGQNVNSYGKDLEQPLTFAQLLRKVNAIPGEFVVRFMSSHPKDATPELLDTILECPKIGHHLHLPVQSGSDDVLRRMNRRYTVEKYMESVNYLRQRDPDFSLTTDLIVGFPDESEADFQGTLDLIRSVQYDNIYTFIYSKRRGTKAAEMEDHTTDAEKKNRMERLLALQRDIASEHNKRFIGRTLRVLVDGESKRKGRLVGKDSAFIIVEFSGDPSLIGTFQNVRITEARNWAVLGELVEEEQA